MGLFDKLFRSSAPPDKAQERKRNVVCTDLTMCKVVQDAISTGTDLVEMTSHRGCCGECAKYQGRVFSLTGKDKRFPRLPEQVFTYGGIHPGCRHNFYPFYYGLSKPICGAKDIIRYSNRPFTDDRTSEEKAEYEAKRREEEALVKDRKDYELLCRKLPDAAPKSFNGYRRMKASGSKNFQQLREKAKKVGIHI